MIIRRQHNSGYQAMPNKVFDDEALSLEASGLLGYLLTKPDHWRANVKDIQKRRNIGRDKAYRIMRELIDAGYVERRANRDTQGRITDYDYIVFDCPETEPLPENPHPLPDLPDTDNPLTDNQHAYKKTDSKQLLIEHDDAKARARIVHETGEQVADAMGVKDDPNWFGDYSRIHAWIAQGFDPQLDIVPAVQAVMKRRRGQPPPKSLRYFDQPVAAYHENRTRPVDHDPSTTTSSQQFSNRRPNDPHNEWLAAFAEVGSE